MSIAPDDTLVQRAQKAHSTPVLVHDIQLAVNNYLFHCENNNLEQTVIYAGEIRRLLTAYEALTRHKLS